LDTVHIRPQQLADRWLLNVTTLDRWRSEGKGPPYLKLRGRVLYRLADVDAYEARHLLRSPSEPLRTGGVA
jgi:hypothetical protein